MTTNELWAKFEAFFSDCNLRRLNMRSDCYEDARIALLWEGWQAAYDSRDAEVEVLKDALFQISVRLNETREPDMDDMSWHTDMIARAQYFANVVTEVEALRKDAERYRWLRDTGDATWTPLCERMPNYDVDSAIDDAMREVE